MRRSSSASRTGIGVAIVLLVVGLQVAIELLGEWDRLRLMFRIGQTALQIPLTLVVLSYVTRQAKRRHLGSIATVLAGVVVAGAIGSLFGLGVHEISHRFPELSRGRMGPGWSVMRAMAFGFLFGLFQFGIWALAFVFPHAVEDERMRALEAERLVAAADLARLRSHLEPHFILNTLNAIAGLVGEDPRQARRLIGSLGDLLRDATQDGGEMRTVDEEIAWLRRYAAILEARYGDMIAFDWDVDPKANGVMLPRLLLQPLVENAVKHGALKREEGGSVRIKVDVDAEMVLRCVIEDDGPGLSDAKPREGAVGLAAVRRRLALKDERARLAIDSSPAGTRATVEWPIEAS